MVSLRIYVRIINSFRFSRTFLEIQWCQCVALIVTLNYTVSLLIWEGSPRHSWSVVVSTLVVVFPVKMSFRFHPTYMVPYLSSLEFSLEPMVSLCFWEGDGSLLPLFGSRPFRSWDHLFHSWVGAHSILGWGGVPFYFLAAMWFPQDCWERPRPLAPPVPAKHGGDVAPKIWIGRPRPSKKVEGDDPPRVEWTNPRRIEKGIPNNGRDDLPRMRRANHPHPKN